MSAFVSLIRRALFWSHLTIGVAAGLLIMLMSVTGVMLGFERQMIAGIDGDPTVEPVVSIDRLPLDTLLARNGISRDAVSSIAVKRADDQPVLIRFRDRERASLSVDPWRGDSVTFAGESKGQAIFSGLRRWHRWVGNSGGEWRARMKAATGAANLGFLLLVMSGIWLWWPKRLTWSSLRSVLWFRRGLSPKARDFNWHHTIGFWSAIPLFAVVASGVFISYDWPERWLDRALGSPAERAAAMAPDIDAASLQRGSGAGENAVEASEPPTRLLDAPLQQLASTAMIAYPDWKLVTVTVPDDMDSTTNVAVAEGNTYRPDLRTTLVLSASDARVVEKRDYASLSTSRRIRSWVRFGHTGEVFGLFGQLITTIVTAGGAVLVWTGIALSWRRLIKWWARA